MDTPYCFFRLLVKGSYLNDNEKNTVRTIYDSFGMNCIYEIVKEKENNTIRSKYILQLYVRCRFLVKYFKTLSNTE